jgi:hypothetical protein
LDTPCTQHAYPYLHCWVPVPALLGTRTCTAGCATSPPAGSIRRTTTRRPSPAKTTAAAASYGLHGCVAVDNDSAHTGETGGQPNWTHSQANHYTAQRHTMRAIQQGTHTHPTFACLPLKEMARHPRFKSSVVLPPHATEIRMRSHWDNV